MKLHSPYPHTTTPVFTIIGFLLALGLGAYARAHNAEARYIEPLPWKLAHFSRVYAMGYAELGHDLDVSHAEMKNIAGRLCAVGNLVAFEVDSKFAYDIDEPVELTLTYSPEFTTSSLAVQWNKNGGTGRGYARINVEPGATFRTVKLTLDRARFAKFGTRGVDLAISTTDDKTWGIPDGKIAVCGVQIERRAKREPATNFGTVRLEVKEGGTGIVVPARVGLYDPTGRTPMPSDQALLVERFADKVWLLTVDPRAFWPSESRVAFYVTGNYEGTLPAGRYELVVSHGPEYRVYHAFIDVRKNEVTRVSVNLERYADLPAHGWYSGDDHIHLARDKVRDLTVWTQVAAEDVHVGNLLQMGNISGVYFEQPAWGEAGRFQQGGYLIASGQEDPRTGHLGHTIHENLQHPIHLAADSYFLYDRVFDESHRQGGISGYAHLNADWFNVLRGVALDVPFGKVDFLEILQAGKLSVDAWYSCLNLGFHITPSAGSDFPYTDLPGVVRVYVQVKGAHDPDAWYAAFRAGHAYVTNGPFLEFTVNGHPMGDEIHVSRGAPLDVVASAQMNPDVDRLDRLELVVLGDVTGSVTASGRDRVTLEEHLTADHSMWIAVRAYGGRHEEWNTIAAHSAPVYVIVGNEPTWKRDEVPRLVARQRAMLQEIVTAPIVPNEDLEAFTTSELLLREWPRQQALLRPRVAEADALYQDLMRRAQTVPAQSQDR